MIETIELIIKKYYREDGEYYSRYYYDINNRELQIDNEIKAAFEENPLVDQFEVSVVECFDSCGYGCDMLMAAWTEGGILETYNLLLEAI